MKIKMRFKTILLVITIVGMALGLAGCSESNDSKYKNAQSLLSKEQYKAAAEIFDALGSYEDSSKMAMYCKAAAAGENGDYDAAIKSFETLADYKDCKLMAIYYSARKMQAQETVQSLYEAYSIYDTIPLFRDSMERGESCLKQIYNEGVDSRENKKWSNAISAFETLGVYSDAAEQVLETKYQEAEESVKNGRFESAYLEYSEIVDYKNVRDILNTNKEIIRAGNILQFKTSPSGKYAYVFFGRCEQDNDMENGDEPIKWKVVKCLDDKALLVSEYGIAAKAFHSVRDEAIWETSDIRYWLNHDFLNSAFSEEENDAILLTDLPNSKTNELDNTLFDGNDTQDKLFLLSYHESLEYLNSVSRDGNPTKYARTIWEENNKTLPKSSQSKKGWMLLRTIHDDGVRFIMLGDENGSEFLSFPDTLDYIRPAFWIDFNAKYFDKPMLLQAE